MKKISFLGFWMTIAVFFLFFVPTASAHERRVYTIGHNSYIFIVGSLGEPVFVDDASGVDLQVFLANPADTTHLNTAIATPVEKLEQSLQVEVSAGGKKITLPLSPVWKTPGAYSAHFYPTVATSYTYRIFGTINGAPISVSFECASDSTLTSASTSSVIISPEVTQIIKTGAFGCPKDKSAVSFPEPASSDATLSSAINDLRSSLKIISVTLGIFIILVCYALYVIKKRPIL